MASPQTLGPITSGIGIFTGLAGTALASSSYNSAGNAAISAAQYNSKLIDLNLNRQLDSLASELKTFNSSQKAQIAKSGVSLTSKSSLVVMNEAIRKFEKESVLAKENAELSKNQELFSANQKVASLRTESISNIFGGISDAIFSGASLFSSLGE